MLKTLIRPILITTIAVALTLTPARAQRSPASTPLTVYASVQGAGVFKSSSLGGLWQGPSALPSDVLSLETVNPSNWRVVYAGLRGGLYVSRDGGTTWSQTGLRGHPVYALLVDRRNSSIVLAGTDHGIYRSVDGGATWSQATGAAGAVTALAQSATSGSLFAAGYGHVWLSTGYGSRWSSDSRGLPSRLSISALAVTGTQTTTVLAATAQGMWQLSGSGSWQAARGLPSRSFSAVSASGDRVLAASAGDEAVYASADGGVSWTRRPIDGLTGGITALVVDNLQPATILIGDANGRVGYSTDDGLTWTVPVGGVTGAVGSPVLALSVIHREPLPTDGVPDPHRADTRWFALPDGTGHTLRGAFLSFWNAVPDAASIIGTPLTEPFTDRSQGNATVQYFQRMELEMQNGTVVPAPLGAQLAPTATQTSPVTYTVDPRFQAFWAKYGGDALFGPAVTAAMSQTNGDGTGRAYWTQYFRNARLEYHPELSDPNAQVQVAFLGAQALEALGWYQP